MAQVGFAYVGMGEPGEASLSQAFSISIFADRPSVGEELREDAAAAGLTVRECGPVAALLEGEPRPLGDFVLIDCPAADAATLAALSRLDMRAARAGARLVISTSVTALDDVFACCDQSGAQILVDPTRAERIATLGRLGGTRITGEDRAFRVASPALAFARPAPPPPPDPRLVRRIIRQRQLRARFFDPELFADPAWDILLDLTAARAEHARVSVTSLCIASGVPPTTALRWIGQMIDSGLLKREQDDMDRRRAFVALTDDAADAMAHYFAEFDQSALQLA